MSRRVPLTGVTEANVRCDAQAEPRAPSGADGTATIGLRRKTQRRARQAADARCSCRQAQHAVHRMHPSMSMQRPIRPSADGRRACNSTAGIPHAAPDASTTQRTFRRPRLLGLRLVVGPAHDRKSPTGAGHEVRDLADTVPTQSPLRPTFALACHTQPSAHAVPYHTGANVRTASVRPCAMSGLVAHSVTKFPAHRTHLGTRVHAHLPPGHKHA